ncbi:MAG: hypothetical protein U0871_07135 [Gemmataceae bacterium]
MSLLAELCVLFEKRKYAVVEVPTELGPTLLLNQDDPEGGVTAEGEGDPAALIEVWQNGDLLCLDAAEIGTLKFASAGELDRFVYDLLARGWENLHPDDYRIVH